MGVSMRLFTTIFMVLLLLMATGLEPAEGRTCESQSQKFKGTCASDTNCGNVCMTEGFPAATAGVSVAVASAPHIVN